MKLYLIPVLYSFGLLLRVNPEISFPVNERTAYFTCDDTPDLNKKIIDFIKSNMNKKVGRGECWDLAAGALNANGASWDKNFRFGKEVDLKKDCLYPGDIIQFENVELEYSLGNRNYREKMAQHTAIIYEIKGEGDYLLADQNTNIHGKRVGLSPLNLKDIKKGKYIIYQPVK